MTNHESPSDLQGFRRTEAGYFAAFVHVLDDSPIAVLGTPGEAWEGNINKPSNEERHRRLPLPEMGTDSRGERSKLSGGRWK